MQSLKIFILFLLSTTLYAAPNYSTAIKEKKIYPMGKKIYASRCQQIDVNSYASYESLLKAIDEKSLCKKLNPKHLEALSLYLWDLQRRDTKEKHYGKLIVSHQDKCPVCGMFLYKYPTWIAKIQYENKAYFFDGIKDLFKYYFEHQKNIQEILVQDYYTQKALDAKESFFVIGSDVYGPMGNEFIAFETLKSAKKFMVDHKGKKLLRFDEISEDTVYGLDD
ncbi:nitrous oxide reductase accessory protein NosL [Sulfurimonas microaerophilic]|uniref:nitrous oxide reductase accessory protein NosL n=1 Tax=Sulfurimonas microaerophilic TaxID=3058392 RepID=UPI002714E638|nr:nitrous oxide reductase accessory protein NosL [Sulfurimonas sp. hsl 1-7]